MPTRLGLGESRWHDGRTPAAPSFLQDRPDVDPERIGAIGFSVGGEMLLETAAGTGALRAVVSEAAGPFVPRGR